MNYHPLFNTYFDWLKSDERLNSFHESLFFALFQFWHLNSFTNPFPVNRVKVMKLSKIKSLNTYHKYLKQLELYGYIKYFRSFNPMQPSMIVIYDKPSDAGSNSKTTPAFHDKVNQNQLDVSHDIARLKIDINKNDLLTGNQTETNTSSIQLDAFHDKVNQNQLDASHDIARLKIDINKNDLFTGNQSETNTSSIQLDAFHDKVNQNQLGASRDIARLKIDIDQNDLLTGNQIETNTSSIQLDASHDPSRDKQLDVSHENDSSESIKTTDTKQNTIENKNELDARAILAYYAARRKSYTGTYARFASLLNNNYINNNIYREEKKQNPETPAIQQDLFRGYTSEKPKRKKVAQKKEKVNIPADLNEVIDFFNQDKFPELEARKFFNHFQSNGWKVSGKTPMKDWKAAARNWMLNIPKYSPRSAPPKKESANLNNRKNYNEPL